MVVNWYDISQLTSLNQMVFPITLDPARATSVGDLINFTNTRILEACLMSDCLNLASKLIVIHFYEIDW